MSPARYNGENTISMTTLRKCYNEIFDYIAENPMVIITVTRYSKPVIVIMGISAYEFFFTDSDLSNWESEGGAL